MDDRLRCPVCGMPVDQDSPWTAVHDAQTYVFCSRECRDAFVADPARFVGNTGS